MLNFGTSFLASKKYKWMSWGKLKGLGKIPYSDLSQEVLLNSVKQYVRATLCKTISMFILSPTPQVNSRAFDTVITISGYEIGIFGMNLVMDEETENIKLQSVIPDSDSNPHFSPSTWHNTLTKL